MNDSRERFEKFLLKDVPEKHRTFVKEILAGYGPEYAASPSVSGAWSAWQAAERDALEREAKVCEWKQDTDYETEIWHTSCGEAFVFNEGGPDENFLKFCCYCGGRLTAIRALAGKE